jgi:pimeloyl-ACP methyl ester carboxylesterase
MPLFTLTRFLFTLVSLAVLGVAGYLIWSWFEGNVVATYDDALIREREDWRVWTGLALLAWSFLGRFITLPLLARPDRDPIEFKRGAGRMIDGAEGASLYVEDDGARDKPVLVFTHGQAVDTTFWAYARRDLGPTHRIIAWDLPGLGKSKHAPRNALSVPAAAQNLRHVIAAARAERVVLVGHSFGGMTLQEFAQSEPELFRRHVAGVVLLNTTFTNPLRTMILSKLALALQKPVLEPMHHFTAWIQPLAWLSNWQAYLSGFAHMASRILFADKVTRKQLDHATLLATRSPPASVELRNVAMYHWHGLESGAYGVPVLVIGGGVDIVTKLQANERIAADIDEARLMVVEKANHMGPLEFAEEYNTAIADFAADVLARTPVSVE